MKSRIVPLPGVCVEFPLALCILVLAGCGQDSKNKMKSREIVIVPEKLEQPFSKALADLDGDGQVDALVGDFGNKIYWYHYPKWEQRVLYAANGGDDFVVLDLNKDGALDVISNGNRIAWYENPNGAAVLDTATRWKEHLIKSGTRSHDLFHGDFNRDGLPDVGMRVENGPTVIFLQGAGPDVWTEVAVSRNNGDGVGTHVADMNGDSLLDVVEGGYWWQQPANIASDVWPKVQFTAWSGACAVRVADMNKDGRPDVLLAPAYSAHQLSWFANPGNGGNTPWTEHVVLGGASHVHRFHVIDVDGDADLDVVFAEQHQSHRHRVGAMRNMDGMGLTWELVLFSERGAHNIALANIGNDDTWDLLAVNWAGDTRIRLLRNLMKDPKEDPLSTPTGP